jgi:structural maintenance of chromosomes protein 5
MTIGKFTEKNKIKKKKKKLLGRAKDVGDYVKHGCNSGWVEIVLSGGSAPDITIFREIKKDGGSTWKLDGKICL